MILQIMQGGQTKKHFASTKVKGKVAILELENGDQSLMSRKALDLLMAGRTIRLFFGPTEDGRKVEVFVSKSMKNATTHR